MAYPRKIERWETSDGTEHRSEEMARDHEESIARAERANAVLRTGGSVAVALNVFGSLKWYTADDAALLDLVSRHTGLTIEHWQCRREPGYTVRSIDAHGRWWVHGDAGSWSGPYGAVVETRDLIRYARDTYERNGGTMPPVWTRPLTPGPGLRGGD